MSARIGAWPADHVLAQVPGAALAVGDLAGQGAAVPADAVVLICLDNVLDLVRVLSALDGAVAGLLLVSTSQTPEVVAELAALAGAGVVVTDRADLDGVPAADVIGDRTGDQATGWMMTTSGTTGIPKIVPHTFDSLSRTVRRDPFGATPVWGLVYEMTRFAGLQVALQSLAGGGTLAAAPRHAPMPDQVAFMAQTGVTHLSATPTLWRRLLMVPGLESLPLKQVTMGGEIADQAVLDAAAARFPKARLTHIYASTEAGVGFAVNDRQAGFPLRYCDEAPGGVGIRITDSTLWLRPPGGRQIRYLGGQAVEVDADGYVATGDMLEVTNDRALFLGRDSGVVNVGGVKVYPERVERVIAAVPGVGLAQVISRKNPITGALLMANVVAEDSADQAALKVAITETCRAELEREAVPARITFVAALEMNAAGKIKRG
nr:class I adenylate-forming enzyme family protein [Actibacterium sp. 188UL27-1]